MTTEAARIRQWARDARRWRSAFLRACTAIAADSPTNARAVARSWRDRGHTEEARILDAEADTWDVIQRDGIGAVMEDDEEREAAA